MTCGIWRETSCPTCNGAGKRVVIDGPAMRVVRQRRKMSLRNLSAKVGVSAMYLCDIELGRRTPGNETADLIWRALSGRIKR